MGNRIYTQSQIIPSMDSFAYKEEKATLQGRPGGHRPNRVMIEFSRINNGTNRCHRPLDVTQWETHAI